MKEYTKIFRILFYTLFLFTIHYSLFTNVACANNITVSGVTITGQDTPAQTCKVQFDVSWDNSWRNSVTYDAAWVFVKYSTDGGSSWTHATLKSSGTNPAGFSQGAGTGLDIGVPADKKGAFLQRNSNGSGSVSTAGIQFVWDWGIEGLFVNTTALLKVFAIEMVHIPEGAFYAGDPDGSTGPTNCFYTSGTEDAYQISSEAAISIGATSGYLYYDADNSDSGDQLGPIPANFPKGYNAFYLMKYEISQEEYVDFFNTLTDPQKAERDITGNHATYGGKDTDSEVYRNSISWTSGDASAGANANVACNYLAWADLAAYADWAGLRPITELEFEKAARGPTAAINGEYVWGSKDIDNANTLLNGSTADEGVVEIGNGLCNYNNDGMLGPLRCGFAATSNTTRSQAGAGYYGNMELSGNLWEICVTVGNGAGRAFTGLHGNGILDAGGDANVSGWPGTNGVGSGFRGGNWFIDSSRCRVSDRFSAAAMGVTRSNTFGSRFGRTAP